VSAQTEQTEGTLFSHLLELRNRLLYSMIGVMVFFIPGAIYSREVYSVLAQPLMEVLPQGASMIATEVASPFLTPLKLAFVLAIVLSIPNILYQVWAFVAPGLYRHERRLVFPLLASSTFLFYCGMAFAYFVVFPLVFGFFTQVAPAGVQIMTDIKSYLDFIFSMFLAFGVAFELPVAIILLTHAGVVSPDTLAEKRPYVVVWVFVIAMLLTPPDVISQTLLAIPMLLLFEIGLFVARRTAKRSEDEEIHTLTEEEMEKQLDSYDSDAPEDKT